MTETVVHEKHDTEERLATLGLSQAILSTVLLRADAEAAHATPLDPPTAEGMARYAATVRFLRMALVPRGWDYDNADNFCRTIAPTSTFSIVTSSGDSGTGEPLGTPSTKYMKGETTFKAVARNQLTLDLGLEFDSGEDSGVEDLPTWFLLQRVDRETIHAELSLPSDISGGRINLWEERIILDSVDRGGLSPVYEAPDEDDGIAYDVDVARR